MGGSECETFSCVNKSQSSQKLLAPDLGEMEVVDEVQVALPVGNFSGEHQVYQEGEKHIGRESLERNKEIRQFSVASHTASGSKIPSVELSIDWLAKTPTVFLKQATFSNGLMH